mmetsp:Transcript_12312/g.35149  ORF Transcript_12312/g.35149 Transcript_12312/m.35149 type:complete len:87 (+) Transcript_12312:277-537(+)
MMCFLEQSAERQWVQCVGRCDAVVTAEIPTHHIINQQSAIGNQQSTIGNQQSIIGDPPFVYVRTFVRPENDGWNFMGMEYIYMTYR